MINDAALDRILALAEELPFESLELLIGELRLRRSEKWWAQLDKDVKQTRRDLRAGKLKAMTWPEAKAHLESIWASQDE